MLRTIRIPQNLKLLAQTLPKPNYEPMMLKKVEKSFFIKTLEDIKKQRHYSYSTNKGGKGDVVMGTHATMANMKGLSSSNRSGGKSPEMMQKYLGNISSGQLALEKNKRLESIKTDKKSAKMRYLDKKQIRMVGEMDKEAYRDNHIMDYRKKHMSPDQINKRYDNIMKSIRKRDNRNPNNSIPLLTLKQSIIAPNKHPYIQAQNKQHLDSLKNVYLSGNYRVDH